MQARGTFIHLACQYIYFPLLVLFLFAAVKQYTLSKQLVFLGADEWIQKERYTRIMEISTLQDLVQKGFTRINIMISIAITIRTSLSAFLCVATVMYQSQIYHICRWIELSGARSEYPALCRNTHSDEKEAHLNTRFSLSIQAPWVSAGMQGSCIWH